MHTNCRQLLRIEFQSDFSLVPLLSTPVTPLRRLAFRLSAIFAVNCLVYFHCYFLHTSAQNEPQNMQS